MLFACHRVFFNATMAEVYAMQTFLIWTAFLLFAHLTRDHGVFAPASPDLARDVPRSGPAADNQTNQSGEASSSDRQRG